MSCHISPPKQPFYLSFYLPIHTPFDQPVLPNAVGPCLSPSRPTCQTRASRPRTQAPHTRHSFPIYLDDTSPAPPGLSVISIHLNTFIICSSNRWLNSQSPWLSPDTWHDCHTIHATSGATAIVPCTDILVPSQGSTISTIEAAGNGRNETELHFTHIRFLYDMWQWTIVLSSSYMD